MHIFEVHSNESACRKSGRLGMEQVIREVQGCTLTWQKIESIISSSWAMNSSRK